MSTPTDPQRARALRRRHEHERQAVVFGVIIALLAVVAVAALALYTGAIKSPFDKEFVVVDSAQSKVSAPCIPDDTLPVSYNKIKVEVLNARGQVGLAGIVGEMLTERGFTVTGVGTTDTVLPYVEISTNADGLAAAYTLAAQFVDPVIVLDDRKKPTVTAAIGEDFENFVPVDDVKLSAKTPLESLPGCVPVESLTPRHVEPAEKSKG